MSFSPIPSGVVFPFAGDNAPESYLICDGSIVSRTTYAALFAAIGIAHGEGDGSTTFHLPDYRGRFMRGVDDGATNDPNAGTRTAANTGGNTGDEVGSIQDDILASHGHFARIPSGGYVVTAGSTVNRASGTNTTTGTINVSGTMTSTGGAENRPKNAYVNYIIKV